MFGPLIRLLRERGDEVEVTAREYAQTLQLLELHGIEATVVGRHGGARGSARRGAAVAAPRAAQLGEGRGFDLALAHGSYDLT